MKQITEISRRSTIHTDEGMACGPVSSTAIMAEIVVEADGERIFLYGEWVDFVDGYDFAANKGSIYGAYMKMFDAKNEDEKAKAIKERNDLYTNGMIVDIAFKPYFKELKQMIYDEMDEHGLGYFHEDQVEDDVEFDMYCGVMPKEWLY